MTKPNFYDEWLRRQKWNVAEAALLLSGVEPSGNFERDFAKAQATPKARKLLALMRKDIEEGKLGTIKEPLRKVALVVKPKKEK